MCPNRTEEFGGTHLQTPHQPCESAAQLRHIFNESDLDWTQAGDHIVNRPTSVGEDTMIDTNGGDLIADDSQHG